LREVIGPMLAAKLPKPKGGRPRVPDRAALEGIVYVLRSGIPCGCLRRSDANRRHAHRGDGDPL
jgi:transposase